MDGEGGRDRQWAYACGNAVLDPQLSSIRISMPSATGSSRAATSSGASAKCRSVPSTLYDLDTVAAVNADHPDRL